MPSKTVRLTTAADLAESTTLVTAWSADWDLQFDAGSHEVDMAPVQGAVYLFLDGTPVTALSLSQDGTTLSAVSAVSSVGISAGDPVATRESRGYVLGDQTDKPLASQEDMDEIEEGLDEILDSNDQEIYDSNDQEVLKTETWTFVLDGGAQITKSVFVR